MTEKATVTKKATLSNKDKIFWGLIFAGLLGFVMYGRAPATSAEQTFTGEPEVVAVTFASAWCSACKIVKPRVVSVMDDFSNSPVKFVELDFTFGQRTEIREIAVENGFTLLYDKLAGSTGFTVLVDRDTGGIIDTLSVNHNEEAMRQAIDRALTVATAPAATRSEAAG